MNITFINRGVGTPQAHRTGCADLAKDARGASIWTVEAGSLQEIVEDLAADFLDEDPDTTWEDFEAEVRIMNCVGHLPRTRQIDEATASDTEAAAEAAERDAAEAAAAPAQRTNQTEIIVGFLIKQRDRDITDGFTPHAISKATGHKGLRDACARLARLGLIEQTSEKPAAYRAKRA